MPEPKQPSPKHGIHGTARTEPWLTLDDDQSPRRAMFEQFEHQRSAVGLTERMWTPKVGDLVVELSYLMRDHDHHCLGYLIKQCDEWLHSEEAWEHGGRQEWGDDPRPYEDVWYVQYGPSPEDVVRWTNCSFYAIAVDGAYAA